MLSGDFSQTLAEPAGWLDKLEGERFEFTQLPDIESMQSDRHESLTSVVFSRAIFSRQVGIQYLSSRVGRDVVQKRKKGGDSPGRYRLSWTGLRLAWLEGVLDREFREPITWTEEMAEPMGVVQLASPRHSRMKGRAINRAP